MRILFYSVISFFILVLCTHVHGQTFYKGNTVDWNIANVDEDKYYNSYVFDRYILDMSLNEKIIPVRFDKSSWGIAKIDIDSKVIWQIPVSGFVSGLGKLGDAIIAITTDGKNVSALLVNAVSGKLQSSKFIHSSSSDKAIEAVVHNKPDGSFNDLMITSMPFNGSFEIEGLYVSDAQNMLKKLDLKSFDKNKKILGCAVNKSGELFTSALSGGQLIVSQYNSDMSFKRNLSTPFVDIGLAFQQITSIDQDNENRLIIALNYQTSRKSFSIRMFIFDLESKTVIVSDEENLDKNYVKTIELEKPKGVSDGSMKDIEKLSIVGIVQSDDKIVVVKEMRTWNYNNLMHYYNNAWIVSFYNRDLKLSKRIGLDKFYTLAFPIGLSLGFHKSRDQLFIVSSSMKVGAYVPVLSTINLKTEKIEKIDVLNKKGVKIDAMIDREQLSGLKMILYFII